MYKSLIYLVYYRSYIGYSLTNFPSSVCVLIHFVPYLSQTSKHIFPFFFRDVQ
nr:MAG TPA: hypothetical protein [Microviridae sp.]